MFDRIRKSELEITLPPLYIYDQTQLIKKVNQYFTLFNRPLWDPKGYCQGLTLLWHQKMRDYKERQFYGVIKKIIHYPIDKLAELEDDVEVQKFIAQVQFAQNCWLYGFGDELRSIDVDKILEAPGEMYLSGYFSIKSFAKMLDENARSRVSISVHSPSYITNHHIGIYFRDERYYVFDSNYGSGEAKTFIHSMSVAIEMTNCLYRNFNVTSPQWMEGLRVMLVNPVPSPQISLKDNPLTMFQRMNLTYKFEIQVEETSELKPR